MKNVLCQLCLNKAVYIKFHLNFYGLGLVVQLMPPKYRLQLTKFAVVKGTQQVVGLLVTAFLRTRTETVAASVFAENERAHPDSPAGLKLGKTVGTAPGPTQVIAK